jgi:hypothetical protein
MTNTTCPRKKKERGIALLIVIFALLLVTGIALAMMSSSATETQVEKNYRDSQRAYFAALAGIQEARVRLLTENSNAVAGTALGVVPNGGTNKGMPQDGNATGVIYLLNPNSNTQTVAPWDTGNAFYDDELCHEIFPGLTATSTDPNSTTLNVPCTTTPGSAGWYTTKASKDPNTGTSAALSYKWVRISMKENRSGYPYMVTTNTMGNNTPICWDGSRELPLPSGWATCNQASTYETVYRVASLAVVPNAYGGAGTRRMVVAEVAKTPPLMTNAAVDSQDHVTLNGQLTVDGFDYCTCDYSKCTSTTTGKGGNEVTTYDCPSLAGKSCDKSKWAIYAAQSVDNPTSSEQEIAYPNPPVVQNQPWNYDIAGLINTYKQGAVNVTGPPYNFNCTGGACGTQAGGTYGVPPAFPPTPVDQPLPSPSYGSCNTSTTPWTGTGCPQNQITYVPGNLQMTGGSVGNGILIVDGDLDIHGGLEFYGLILVRGVIKFTGGGSDKTNIFGAVLAGQESYVDNTLGGSAVINFNSCALKQNTIPQPPRLLSIREATY